MPQQRGLHFHRRDVLAAADDDVLQSIANLNVTVGMNHCRIARVEPAIAHGGVRGGVFWHTQGAGKSLSMVFFAQKIFRKIEGNWTFVIVTDRVELDDQIAETFKNTVR
jgi:type I restriction enzyme R subunit